MGERMNWGITWKGVVRHKMGEFKEGCSLEKRYRTVALFILRQINFNESIKFWEDAAAEN